MDNLKNKNTATTTEPDIKKAFDTRMIKKGMIYFLLITVGSLGFLFFYNNGKTATVSLSSLQPSYLGIAILMSVLDMTLGGWRNHIFARLYQPGISQWVCFRANLANIFLGAITPSQSGGGPAQLYIWYREGIKLSQAIAISLINWFSTLIFFPLAALAAMYFIGDQYSETIFTVLLRSGFSIFGTLLVVIIIAFWKPMWIGHAARKLAGWIGNLNENWKTKLEVWGDKTYLAVQEYQVSCKETLVKYKWLFPLSFLLTILLYFNKFCLAYLIVLGVGGVADFWTVIAVQVVLQFVLYFAPSPGGSGIAEFSIAVLMAGILTDELVPVFTLLHRVFLLFLPALLGALVVVRELRKHAEE